MHVCASNLSFRHSKWTHLSCSYSYLKMTYKYVVQHTLSAMLLDYMFNCWHERIQRCEDHSVHGVLAWKWRFQSNITNQERNASKHGNTARVCTRTQYTFTSNSQLNVRTPFLIVKCSEEQQLGRTVFQPFSTERVGLQMSKGHFLLIYRWCVWWL